MRGEGAPQERVLSVNSERGRKSRLGPWGSHRKKKRKEQETGLHLKHSPGDFAI